MNLIVKRLNIDRFSVDISGQGGDLISYQNPSLCHECGRGRCQQLSKQGKKTKTQENNQYRKWRRIGVSM